MELQAIAATALTILGPYFADVGEAFAKAYGAKLADKVVALHATIRKKFGDDHYAEQTLARAEEKPNQEGRKAALQDVLVEKMEADPQFAETVSRLVQEVQSISGTQTTTVGGDVRSSSTITGSTVSNSTIISGESLTVVLADRYWQGAHQAPPSADLRKTTERYLHYVIDRYSYLSFKGMGITDRVALRFPLLQVYVPLRARGQLPDGDTWQEDLRLAGRPLLAAEAEPGDGEVAERPPTSLGEPRPVLDLLGKHAGLVVLGDPGAGKTTLVKYLALQLALGRGPDLGLGHRLPVVMPLAAYATALEQEDIRLDDFIGRYFQQRVADLPVMGLLAEALERGAALVLLDGLDEVRSVGLRSTVVERVVDFYTFHRRAGNKFLITSRVIGYNEVRPMVEDMAECTLVDFDDAEIERFIDSWTSVLEQQAQGDTEFALAEAQRERAGLLTAVRTNASIARLASNPLLLTILALMQRQGISLPERRVQLYDQYIRTLLSTWNRARSLTQRAAAPDLDDVQTMRILAPLALWMHETKPGIGLARREDVRRKLETLYHERGAPDPEQAANRFLEDVRDHAGLVLERGAGIFGFIHLTFEEYLAAVGVALREQGNERAILDFLCERVCDPAWHEVALLTLGYLGVIQQLDSVAGAVIEGLLQQPPGPRGAVTVLAGQAVLDGWPGGVPMRTRDRVVQALVPVMQDAEVTAPLRRQAGLLLGRLGWQPGDLDQFVEVPSGDFRAGADRQPRRITNRCWLAKYPVTNSQYARFVSDRGYERPELWSEDGWIWKGQRREPKYWGHGELANPIFPVVGLSWFEAQAYCNWLSGRLPGEVRTAEGEWPATASQALVRLPTQEEWERAAAGWDDLTYPWGNTFAAVCANTRESDTEKRLGIGTTAVCTYPQGMSPAGAWDMSGNVWEWTQSWWSKGPTKRCIKGGSWISDSDSARCTGSSAITPDAYLDFIGFRPMILAAVAR